MGNAPLSSPSQPTATRAVIFISNQSLFCGVKLSIVDNGLCDGESLPAPLGNLGIAASEYSDKLEMLQNVLNRWRGGYALLLVSVMALTFVVAFFVAFFIKEFWTSVLFTNFLYVVSIAAFQLVFFGCLLRYSHRETLKMQDNVVNLFQEWRERGVNVSMKKVAAPDNRGDTYYYRRPRNNDTPESIPPARRKQKRGNINFCVIMDVITDEEQDNRGRNENGDNESVATANTDNSDEHEDSEV